MRPWRVVGNAKQKKEAILELFVSKSINNVQGIPPESESGTSAHPKSRRLISQRLDNLRDEVNAITQSSGIFFSVGCTGGADDQASRRGCA